MNPLLHKISQQSEQGVKERDIEKDAIATCRGMRGIEQRIVEKNLEGPWDKLETSLAPKLQRSSDDELPEKLSSAEVKLLQEQKKYLQREVHLLLEQHDVMMSEIQNLTVRIAELSAVNNDSFKGTQDANPATARPNSSNSMLQLFTEKIKREQKLSGGNHYDAESGHLLSDKESILSFNLDLSPENSHDYSNRGSAMDSIKDKYHEVHVDEGGGLVLRKVNKRGTPNTIRSVGTIFNKFLGDGSSLSHENSNNAVDQLSNSDDSETRSLGELFPERHYFLQHNFVRPVRCEFCENKLWGREYKCRDCGIVIHGKCKSESIPVCSKRITDSSAGCMDLVTPTLSNARAMFGTSLTEQLEYEQSNIPLVVEKCIEAVNKRGLEVEGIYRRSGLAAEIKQLVQAYDSGQQPDLLDSTLFQDICSITSVLKQYLRSLPEPLIPFTLYNSFMDAVSLSQNNDRIQMSRHLIEHMPYAHYQTVKLLLEHLRKVTFHERVNLMTAKNLSVVFGPTLMRNPDPTREIEDMTLRNLVIEHLIINVHNLFDTAVSNDVNGTLLRGNANIRTDTSPNSLSSESSMDTAEDAY
ncbi:Rho GTPase activation protein [Lobosporangium transversale]|uniref:Rho GTPase activation protein n=1 Tax=Lobosporangium transversale TaxID=64571 RepID=A0A1Y2GBH2_9FUNG|nr:Rho GTPase activation protein [Lobosporangium transversale]ORZ06336.1 Rho GTPase activation protein [Lobosporangium transversale]|eukprot:XP_021877499.1 Rho GTPase activation protein [Lobosporangium transversale]